MENEQIIEEVMENFIPKIKLVPTPKQVQEVMKEVLVLKEKKVNDKIESRLQDIEYTLNISEDERHRFQLIGIREELLKLKTKLKEARRR